MISRRPILHVSTQWKYSQLEQPQSPGPRRVPSRLTYDRVPEPPIRGLPKSPPRRVVHPFTPKNLVPPREQSAPTTGGAPEIPPGGHPWFRYSPELMV